MASFDEKALTPERLLLAVPKKGRLYDKIVKLLAGIGLDYNREPRLDIANCTNLPVTIVFLPAADIALYVGEGHIDIGITGEDIIAESNVSINVLQSLGFGKCKLCVQVPVDQNSSLPMKDRVLALRGKRIVTSFPHLAKKFFAELEGKTMEETLETKIKFVSGSVEAACGLGLADGIIDLVETGTTMKAAGLEDIVSILTTETVLISNPHSIHNDLIKIINARIQGYLYALKHQMIQYNISRSNLDKAIKITPGKRSPCIIPLEEEGWVAVSAMVLRNQTGDIMDRLTKIGALDILLFEIANCRVG